jgi:hypothetical protein
MCKIDCEITCEIKEEDAYQKMRLSIMEIIMLTKLTWSNEMWKIKR